MRLSVAVFSLLCLWAYPSLTNAREFEKTDSARTKYEQMMVRRMERWQKLIPDHYKAQFAGSIGVFSVGTDGLTEEGTVGEPSLMIGFFPSSRASAEKPC